MLVKPYNILPAIVIIDLYQQSYCSKTRYGFFNVIFGIIAEKLNTVNLA